MVSCKTNCPLPSCKIRKQHHHALNFKNTREYEKEQRLKEKEKLEVVYKETGILLKVFKDDQIALGFLTNPVLSFFKKKEIFDKVLKDKLTNFTMSVLYFIIKNKRSNLLIQILEQYSLLYREYKQIMYVDLITAKKANDELKNTIIKRLGQEQKVLLKSKSKHSLK